MKTNARKAEKERNLREEGTWGRISGGMFTQEKQMSLP